MPVSPGRRDAPTVRRLAAFVHGYSCSPEHWSGAPASLGGDVDLRLIALPGHGGTPLPPGRVLDIDACVDRIAECVTGGARAGACLIGHSLGGMVGLQCVRWRPDLFAALVLVDAFPKLGPPPPFDKSFWSGSPPDLKSRTVKDMMNTRRKLPSSLWESVVAFDATPYLPDLHLPVHGIYGDRGEADHVSLRAALLRIGLGRIPGVRLHLVPQAGHFVMLEQPEAFYGLLAQILADLSGR